VFLISVAIMTNSPDTNSCVAHAARWKGESLFSQQPFALGLAASGAGDNNQEHLRAHAVLDCNFSSAAFPIEKTRHGV